MTNCILDKFSLRQKCVFCDHPERCLFQSVEERNDFTNDVISCVIKNSQKGQYTQLSHSELFEINSCLSFLIFNHVPQSENMQELPIKMNNTFSKFISQQRLLQFCNSYSAKFEGYLNSEMQGPHRRNGH